MTSLLWPLQIHARKTTLLKVCSQEISVKQKYQAFPLPHALSISFTIKTYGGCIITPIG